MFQSSVAFRCPWVATQMSWPAGVAGGPRLRGRVLRVERVRVDVGHHGVGRAGEIAVDVDLRATPAKTGPPSRDSTRIRILP